MKFFKGITLMLLLGLGLSMVSVSTQGQFGGWQFDRIGPGTKPALALDSQGTPLVVYMLERIDGWVRSAQQDGFSSLEGVTWNIETIAEGRFEGPPALSIDGNDVAHVSYHDFQGPDFRIDLGDAVHAQLLDGIWVVNTLEHAGHDGWDNAVTVDANNNVHMSAIDPQDFNGSGVEYYFIDQNGNVLIEELGSDPLTNQFGTSIATTRSGVPYISFYDQDQRNLKLARRTGSNRWGFETVDREDGSGLFSSMAIDADGGVHISYITELGLTFAKLKYAYQSDPGARWEITELDILRDIVIGVAGARNVTSIALDSEGNPWIAYGDQQVVRLAIFDGDIWETETVVVAQGDLFGQIASLQLDGDDRPHLAYSVVTNQQVLDGFIMYATR